jgi:hypothetical protein
MAAERGIAMRSAPREGPGGSQLLATDFRVMTLLLHNAHRRVTMRVLGVSEADADLAGLIAVAVAAHAIGKRTRRMLRAPGQPSATDFMFGGAGVREVMRAIIGSPADQTPYFGALLMLALLAGPSRRAVAESMRSFEGGMHRMNSGFHHRYGYLVDPLHMRLRRAQRKLRT